MKCKTFNIILIDPPWQYRSVRAGGGMKSGAAQKYRTLSLEQICNLPVKQVIDKNSVLFLWTTVPMMQDAFTVMASYGFKYKTAIFWRKMMSMGMGWWFRGQVELILLGIRGKVKAFRCQTANFLEIKPLKHSQKPPEFRELIELATANMPDPHRLEMFATEEADGWTCIGLEIDGKDILDSLAELIGEE